MTRSPLRRRLGRAAGLALGVLADRRFGDPRRGHPVAVFGSLAHRAEARLYADDRAHGVRYAAACVAGPVALGLLAERGRWRPLAVAAATWTVLGGRSLAAEAEAVGALLARGELPAARLRLTHLVGRDTSQLDEAGVSRAVVESVAENACDAVVAPLLWGAVVGLPGLFGYRAANTLDAMVGHRTPRYERFGWAAARFDDLLNLAPARLTALLAGVGAPAAGGSPAAAWRAARRWGRAHPSPNAGMSEAAFAGALGLRLGGRNVYGGTVDDRPVLGDGRAPGVADIDRAVVLLRAVTTGAAAVAVVAAVTT
ncbi:adenosylcobinamide-phosphate synthase [Jatrophihabitans endophyticus]|uniref:Cobalamin biosynthesis protein CobD n=1 Tax=Jatrophihabitans endophyticus TaxID=1206085 RepID=A0A1M5Q7G4_9ACTN|nr:cobalamin biosynthesis protein [Jatrophihabitans endophyticus]SHH10114.1 adenosylcobinamide-phosphate synthase [Jatrophihabitans endophyticus]